MAECTFHLVSPLAGIRRVEDSEEGGDLPDEPATPKLWNAQPFPMPPAAPLPTHPAGCARAMPLTKWVRRMHGTGAGATTEAGFWIPQEPAAEEETAGTPTEQTQLTSTGAEKGEDADDVVPAAQLLSLPAGIPERLAVECDGQPGDFIIRSQRVWSDDKDLSLLDYAQLSGNTRWEESVMVCPGGDEEKVALHVWLAAHNLDAATLRTLAANFKGHKLYVAQQKQAVKEENEGAGKGSEGVQQAPASDGGATKADPEKMPRQRPRKRTMTAQHDAEGAPEEGPQPDAVMDAVTAALRPAGKQASSSDGVRPPAKLRRLNSLHSSADLAQTGVDGEEAPAPVAPPLVQGHTPSELVGRWCRVWWPEDAEWYIGAIREYSASRGQHRVWYEMDGEAEWINLIREARNDRVQLLPGSVRSAWPPAPPPLTGQAGLPAAPPAGEQVEQEDEAPVVAPVRRQVQPATASSPVADTRSGPAEGAAAVGRRVSIYSAGEERFFHGTVRTYRADQGKHMILYEDGHADWVVLADEVVVWPAPKQRATAPAGTVPGAKPRSVPAGVPDFLPVCCNAVSGILDVKRLVVTVNGVEMSAGEFERQGGRAATRKWKSSIKLDVGNGVPGMSLESWMIQMGMEPPRPPRPTRATADAVRRRQTGARGQKPTQQAKQPQRRLQDTGTDAKRRPHHRSGCMCIVCRQARKAERVAKIAATTTANRGGAAKEEEEEEEPKGLRYGKRAFLEAVMQLPGAGARPHTLHEVPLSRCWAPAEWIMHRARQHAARDAQSRGDAAPSTATSAALHSALAVTSSPVVDSNLAAQFSLGPGAAGAGRALTMKEKLELCNATEHERIAFGKSGIHGWGLFARLPIRQDTMVVEFRGELLRRTVADAREVRYVEEGADCYIFNLDDDVVLDATQAGTIARFIVSCAMGFLNLA